MADFLHPSADLQAGREAGWADRQREIDELQEELSAVKETLDSPVINLKSGVIIIAGLQSGDAVHDFTVSAEDPRDQTRLIQEFKDGQFNDVLFWPFFYIPGAMKPVYQELELKIRKAIEVTP